jgi:uncharacterized protein with ParB-like and HNH nuclease domain
MEYLENETLIVNGLKIVKIEKERCKMKFSDIPQLIDSGQWECNFDFRSLVKQIEKWSNGEDCEIPLQMNPDFQRGHVWTEEQQIAFIETILRGGAKNARVIYLNDPNWMRHSGRPYKDFVCVDGLQRYTAIKRFVNNEIKAFGYYFDEYEDNTRLRGRLDMKINVNDLETRKDVLEWYLQTNDGGTPHTKEEIERVRELLKKEV